MENILSLETMKEGNDGSGLGSILVPIPVVSGILSVSRKFTV